MGGELSDERRVIDLATVVRVSPVQPCLPRVGRICWQAGAGGWEHSPRRGQTLDSEHSGQALTSAGRAGGPRKAVLRLRLFARSDGLAPVLTSVHYRAEDVP